MTVSPFLPIFSLCLGVLSQLTANKWTLHDYHHCQLRVGRAESCSMTHLLQATILTQCSIAAFSLFFFACASPPESSKSLVKITNVTLSRLDTQTLRVTLYYDLEPGVTLPLSYKTIVVTPLEPSVKIAGVLSEFILSNDSVAVDLDIPAEAGIDWQALASKGACCQVSLKGMREQAGAAPTYERISNIVQVPLPPLAG